MAQWFSVYQCPINLLTLTSNQGFCKNKTSIFKDNLQCLIFDNAICWNVSIPSSFKQAMTKVIAIKRKLKSLEK